MSFFNSLFGKSDENQKNETSAPEAKFYTLNSIEQFDEIDFVSQNKPVVLFKHSTRCSISRFALKQFDNEYHFTEDQMDWYLLDLLNYRELSNVIESRYDVTHQSPQIIVIKKGKAIFNTSHDAIDAGELKQFV